MEKLVDGLHHVSAIAGNPQNVIQFYQQILGLRLVKQTISFDDSDIYHLYFGDHEGNPGSLITFLPYGKDINQGCRGCGQAIQSCFSIPANAISFWLNRLKSHFIPFSGPIETEDEVIITAEDYDGLSVSLVANEKDTREVMTSSIDRAYAIRGLYSATLCITQLKCTLNILQDILGFKAIEHAKGVRLECGDGGPGTYLDLHVEEALGHSLPGRGTLHHVALKTNQENALKTLKNRLEDSGILVSNIMDRKYFQSINFKEPSRVNLEIATAKPGFLIDESLENLGQTLQLPKWEEENRNQIENKLPALDILV